MPRMTKAEFAELRAKARAKIDAKGLPDGMPKDVFADDRTQGRCKCCLCGVELKPFGGFRYIVHATSDKTPDGRHEYILCFLCHAAWQLEVADVEG